MRSACLLTCGIAETRRRSGQSGRTNTNDERAKRSRLRREGWRWRSRSHVQTDEQSLHLQFADHPGRSGYSTSSTIITSQTGDTYWSNAVQAMARRLAEKRLPWRKRTKSADWCSHWCRLRVDLLYFSHRPNSQPIRAADHGRRGRYVLHGISPLGAARSGNWFLLGYRDEQNIQNARRCSDWRGHRIG